MMMVMSNINNIKAVTTKKFQYFLLLCVMLFVYSIEASSEINNNNNVLAAGHYSRILSTLAPYGSKYYLPEGTEFSIYSADTYLYITPDIFTGLMTGLFIFFVLFIGLSCLNSVQGITYFYGKVPIVGKEA